MKRIILSFVFILLLVAIQGQRLVIENPVRFLALGDSYTIGEGVSIAERWPEQLVYSLENSGYSIDILDIIARTGWTTRNLLNAIEQEEPDSAYNLVSLLIGVNNQYQGINFNVYPIEFTELLNWAIALCGGRKTGVFVLSIPDYGYTPFGYGNKDEISAEIEVYNQTNRRITDSLDVVYVNITPISREAESNPDYLAMDNLHPSGIMYGKWVEEILTKTILNNPADIASSEIHSNFTIFPIPAINTIWCKSVKPVNAITIYNTRGVQIINQVINGLTEFNIDISALETGVYHYRVLHTDNTFESGKILIL